MEHGGDLHSDVSSFVPPPDDWFYYHPSYYPSGPAGAPGSSGGPAAGSTPGSCGSSGDSTPVFDTSDGVPCLVPASLMPRSPDDTPKSDVGDLEMDPFSAMYPGLYPAHHPAAHHPYFSQVPCLPGMPVAPVAPYTEDMWMQECDLDYQSSSQESAKYPEDAMTTKKLEEKLEDHRTCSMGYDTPKGCSPMESLPRCIKDPNVLPVVDLTKSEMEILSIQDFKDQKLDYFQKKTKDEKSTVLVVCIDQGMCAAFHLPKEEAKSDGSTRCDTQALRSVIPPFNNPGREYMSVKKSLDKVFPSYLDNRAGVPSCLDNGAGVRSCADNSVEVFGVNSDNAVNYDSLFDKDSHRVFLNCANNTEQEQAVRNISNSHGMFDHQ